MKEKVLIVDADKPNKLQKELDAGWRVKCVDVETVSISTSLQSDYRYEKLVRDMRGRFFVILEKPE